MEVKLPNGETIAVLELVTTIKEVTEDFHVSRGSLYMWMYKDKFEWVKVRGTVLIDRQSFVDFYHSERNRLDVSDLSK
jgi:hypothetical protein